MATPLIHRLGKVSASDLGPGAEEKFHAVRALTYIVADIERDPPNRVSTGISEQDRAMAAAWGGINASRKRTWKGF